MRGTARAIQGHVSPPCPARQAGRALGKTQSQRGARKPRLLRDGPLVITVHRGGWTKGANLRRVGGLPRPGNAAPIDVCGSQSHHLGAAGPGGTVGWVGARDELRGQLCRVRPRAWVGGRDRKKQLVCVSSLCFL